MFANAKYVCIYHSFCRVGGEVNRHEFMLFYVSFHFQTAAGLALDYRAGGRGLDSKGLTNTQGS